jgi:tetratricopeptide (TPR) repeat protein
MSRQNEIMDEAFDKISSNSKDGEREKLLADFGAGIKYARGAGELTEAQELFDKAYSILQNIADPNNDFDGMHPYYKEKYKNNRGDYENARKVYCGIIREHITNVDRCSDWNSKVERLENELKLETDSTINSDKCRTMAQEGVKHCKKIKSAFDPTKTRFSLIEAIASPSGEPATTVVAKICNTAALDKNVDASELIKMFSHGFKCIGDYPNTTECEKKLADLGGFFADSKSISLSDRLNICDTIMKRIASKPEGPIGAEVALAGVMSCDSIPKSDKNEEELPAGKKIGAFLGSITSRAKGQETDATILVLNKTYEFVTQNPDATKDEIIFAEFGTSCIEGKMGNGAKQSCKEILKTMSQIYASPNKTLPGAIAKASLNAFDNAGESDWSYLRSVMDKSSDIILRHPEAADEAEIKLAEIIKSFAKNNSLEDEEAVKMCHGIMRTMESIHPEASMKDIISSAYNNASKDSNSKFAASLVMNGITNGFKGNEINM